MDKATNKKFILIMSILIIAFITLLTTVMHLNRKTTKKIINISYRVPIHNLDPAIAFNNTTLNIISQSYETLYEYHYHKRPFTVQPLLADGMPLMSNNHKVYTIKIKKNIPYHDHPAFKGKTRYVKAIDFVNQIKRLAFLPLNSSGQWIFADTLVGFDKFGILTKVKTKKFYKLNISGLKAINDHTLEFTFKRQIPYLLYLLTMNFIVPIPIEIIHHYSNNLKEALIGTGPFYLDSLTSNQITLKKFKKYPYRKYPENGDRYANDNNLLIDAGTQIPFLDQINFYLEKDPLQQWKLLKQNQLDILSLANSDIIPMINSSNKNENYQIKYFPSLINSWLAFNMKDPVLGKKKPNIRKAIAHAINYTKYIKEITHNTALRSNSLLTPGIQGYDPKSKIHYDFNLPLAKKYLMQAGYPNGTGFPTITYSTRTDEKGSIFEGEFIKNQLANIGINVNIEVLTFKQFWRRSRTGQLQMWTDNWIFDYPDPQNILQLLYSKNHPGINKSAFWDYKVDTLYRKLNQTLDTKERDIILKEIESIIYNNPPWAMLTYERTYVVLNKCIQNYRPSSFIRNFFKYIDLRCP